MGFAIAEHPVFAALRGVSLPAAELTEPMERLPFELAASLLAHTQRCSDHGVRLRVATDAEASHQDLAMPRRHDPEHRPDFPASLPLVEPTPWGLGILVGEEVDQRGALLAHPRVEGRRDASRLAHRPDRSHR
jgi:hypothetical protein